MYLEENLKSLNNKYNPFGLTFSYEGNIIRIKENPKYSLNNHPEIKQQLKIKYKMQFSHENLWHIKKEGISTIKSRKLKLVPTKSIEELTEKLKIYIEMINDDDLKLSIKEILSNNPEFYTSAAAKHRHHAYVGGLLEHTLQTVKIAMAFIEGIDDEISIDKDLVIAGSILHDIGKINCYESTNEGIEITDTYLKQGHIINGIKMISQHIKSEKLDELIHIIASHHNLKDWGSPVEPRSREAWIIHMAENLSSKILG